MYIQTSYFSLKILKKVINDFFGILCDDESRNFDLLIYRSEEFLNVIIEGEMDDFTSHNLVGWLSCPVGMTESFEVIGAIKYNGSMHFVAPDLGDELGEHLLCQNMAEEKYRFNLPECKSVSGSHDEDLIISDHVSRSWEYLDRLSPVIN